MKFLKKVQKLGLGVAAAAAAVSGSTVAVAQIPTGVPADVTEMFVNAGLLIAGLGIAVLVVHAGISAWRRSRGVV